MKNKEYSEIMPILPHPPNKTQKSSDSYSGIKMNLMKAKQKTIYIHIHTHTLYIHIYTHMYRNYKSNGNVKNINSMHIHAYL